MTRSGRVKLRSILLIAGLLIGQTALLLHEVDSKAHADGGPCVICMAGSTLGHGIVSSIPSIATPFTDVIPGSDVAPSFSRDVITCFNPRAPPGFSFV